MSKAADVQDDRELIRHVTNLCSTGHNIFAAVLVARKYPTSEAAKQFLTGLEGDYISEDVFIDLLDLTNAFTE